MENRTKKFCSIPLFNFPALQSLDHGAARKWSKKCRI